MVSTHEIARPLSRRIDAIQPDRPFAIDEVELPSSPDRCREEGGSVGSSLRGESDADDVALAEFFTCTIERGQYNLAIAALYWDRFHQTHKPVERFLFIDGPIDEETNEALNAAPN